MNASNFSPTYPLNPTYKKRVAYFSMEYALQQPLKTYAGGLGYLAGSHMRSAFELGQNMIGIGILWKYGYYDQVRKEDQAMDILFQEKVYGFLQKTDIRFTLRINQSPVFVTAYYLPPEIFKTAPLFFLSTDLPENDYLAQTICHRLYDSNISAQVAAGILLGIGGGKLLDLIDAKPDVYHLNESHGLPLAFYLYEKFWEVEEVKKRLVFTNHTPEEAGNPKTDVHLLESMGYFGNLSTSLVQEISLNSGPVFDHTQAALHFSGIANGVSQMHTNLMHTIWQDQEGIGPITSISNAQNSHYWSDEELSSYCMENDDIALVQRKQQLKKVLFEEVADQTGEIYDENIFTLVWARRFAEYKRPDLLLLDYPRFEKLLLNREFPVQIIWAGKPYPGDFAAISVFDRIAHMAKKFSNCSILVGYELKLSKLLKQGADVWLNNPRIHHEASGTSGMTAAMNAALNLSTADGWVPEFALPNHNCFLIPPADEQVSTFEQDLADNRKLLDLLENEIIPMYYQQPEKWLRMIKNSMQEVIPYFDSNRMAREYYEKLYIPVSEKVSKSSLQGNFSTL